MTLRPIRLNDKQVAELDWVKVGMPDGVYQGGYEHRIVARALESRGLITIRGRGKTWGAAATERGWMWLATPDPVEDDTAKDGEQRSPVVTGDVRTKGYAASRAMRQTRKAKRGNLRVSGPAPLALREGGKWGRRSPFKLLLAGVTLVAEDGGVCHG